MVLAYPYYTLSTQMTDSRYDKSVTKSIAAINLPDMSTTAARNQVAGDLNAVGQLVNRVMGNVFGKTVLTTKEEVV